MTIVPESGDHARAVSAVDRLRHLGLTVATAESLTGGLVSAALTEVPGASLVVRGGVVAYATDAKESLAGVDGAVLREHGPVSAETAVAMAAGVRTRLDAGVGLATTGVAGPDPQGGHAPGTVHVALVAPDRTVVRSFVDGDRMPGDRRAVREATVAVALRLLSELRAGGDDSPANAESNRGTTR